MENRKNASDQWIISWRNFLNDRPFLNTIYTDRKLQVPVQSPELLAEDEIFWDEVRSYFPASERMINLNNGAVSSSTLIVEKAYTTYYSLLNTAPSFYIWKEMEPGKEIVRQGLANLINCSKEEVAILRNTTEALNNVIFGIELEAGDEVVACKQDYAKTVSSWKQRELRDRVKIVWVEIFGTESNEEIIAKYVGAFSKNTKVLQLNHVINWNGQVLPIKEIIREAKARGIQVIVDAAHSFGILDIDVVELGCDYLGATLHKWLSGSITSAMLYVRKDRIAKTWPLASSTDPRSENIRKFEELSIQLMSNVLGLGYAIEFHLNLGRANKEARVRTLRRYWTSRLKDNTSIKFNTPFNESQCAIIVNIAVKDWEPQALENELFRKYNIHVTTVLWENMMGIRITPNIYTQKADLDKIVEALNSITR
jgi:selenocysteine lyase/cysteine desulfurase